MMKPKHLLSWIALLTAMDMSGSPMDQDEPAYKIVNQDSICQIFVYSPAANQGLHLAYLTDDDRWIDVGQLCRRYVYRFGTESASSLETLRRYKRGEGFKDGQDMAQGGECITSCAQTQSEWSWQQNCRNTASLFAGHRTIGAILLQQKQSDQASHDMRKWLFSPLIEMLPSEFKLLMSR